MDAFERVERMRDLVGFERNARPGGDGAGGSELAPGRLVVRRTDQDADAGVTERKQVAHGLLHGHGVVARDAREVQVLDGCVDQHRGQAPLGEAGIVLVRCVRLRVQAAYEDDAGNLLLQQEIDVVGLGYPARRLGAQHRRKAPLREHRAHDLGKCREDWVLQLRQHQPYEPGPLPT
jgi:hypothetical protein